MACVAYGIISLWILSLTVPYHFGPQLLTVPNIRATTRKPLNVNVCMFCLVDVNVE